MDEDITLDNQAKDWNLSVINRANEISNVFGLTELRQGMLDLLLEITEAGSVLFFKSTEDTREFILTDIRGDAENLRLIGLRLSSDQILPASINLKSIEPTIVEDLSREQHWLTTTNLVNAKSSANVVILPVQQNNDIMGIVQIFNFASCDAELLSLLCQRMAHEIFLREEIETKSKENQRLESLIDAIGEVAGTLDRNQILHLVTEKAAELVDAERTSVFLVDPETDEMRFQVAYQPGKDDEHKKDSVDSDRQKPAKPRMTPNRQENSFHFFNRSAITMPIQSTVKTNSVKDESQHILGGLMALTKHNQIFREDDARMMQILAEQTSTFLQVAEMYESAGDLFLGVITALVAAIDAKDSYTQGHSQRVSDISVLIAEDLGIKAQSISDIRIGSLLHDIGKIGIPDSILLKKGKLTEAEFDVIKQHPSMGVKILRQVKLLEPMRPAILEHHERLDGSGYPHKLQGTQISLMGRIVAVADVFDAMTSDRPYRPAIMVGDVKTHLKENIGNLFDGDCVNSLIKIAETSDW